MISIQKGSRGLDVGLLQKTLNEELNISLAVDYICGTKTADAICRYQKKVGLNVDKIAGKKTCSSLGILEEIEELQSRDKVELTKCKNLKQYQQPWRDKSYPPSRKGWSSFKNAACGCIVAVICVDYYDLNDGEDIEDTIYRVAEDAADCGARRKGKGTSAKIFDRNGLNKTSCCKSEVEDSIDNGKPVAVCVKNGWSTYTGNGHWVLIVGYTNEAYIVRDVGSGKAERSLVNKHDWMYVKSSYSISIK